MELSSDQKGAAAELAIAATAARLGIGVYKPLTDGERYDLIFDLRSTLVFGSHTDVTLRLEPCANNQRQGIHWADDYDFDRLD